MKKLVRYRRGADETRVVEAIQVAIAQAEIGQRKGGDWELRWTKTVKAGFGMRT